VALREYTDKTSDSFRRDRERLSMCEARVKLLEVDIATLQDECHNLRRHIGSFQVSSYMSFFECRKW
jgi:hypothetical protein